MIENFSSTFLIRILIIFPLWTFITYLTVIFPLRFNLKNPDRVSSILTIILGLPLLIGVVLSLVLDDFVSGAGIEIIGAYMTGIAFFTIERYFQKIIDSNNETSVSNKMRLSMKKARSNRAKFNRRNRNL